MKQNALNSAEARSKLKITSYYFMNTRNRLNWEQTCKPWAMLSLHLCQKSISNVVKHCLHVWLQPIHTIHHNTLSISAHYLPNSPILLFSVSCFLPCQCHDHCSWMIRVIPILVKVQMSSYHCYHTTSSSPAHVPCLVFTSESGRLWWERATNSLPYVVCHYEWWSWD